MALAREYPEDLDVSFAAVQAWSRSREARERLRRHHGSLTVSRIATEIDLGITDDQVATIPAAFTVIGDHPEWLSRGGILDIARATEGWTARRYERALAFEAASQPKQPGPISSASTLRHPTMRMSQGAWG